MYLLPISDWKLQIKNWDVMVKNTGSPSSWYKFQASISKLVELFFWCKHGLSLSKCKLLLGRDSFTVFTGQRGGQRIQHALLWEKHTVGWSGFVGGALLYLFRVGLLPLKADDWQVNISGGRTKCTSVSKAFHMSWSFLTWMRQTFKCGIHS